MPDCWIQKTQTYTTCYFLQPFITITCTLYVFAFVSICVSGGCLSIIRIVCLFNLNFMEESVGKEIFFSSCIFTSYFFNVNASVKT